jgi:hypothetical protein
LTKQACAVCVAETVAIGEATFWKTTAVVIGLTRDAAGFAIYGVFVFAMGLL